VYFVYDNIINI